MELVKHHDHHFAYGVHWDALDGIGTLQEKAKQVARKQGYASYCITRPKRKDTESLVGGIKTRVARKHVVAAALGFAAEVGVDFAGYLGLLPSGKFVFIGLLNGIPSPSFDIVGDAQSVLRGLEEYDSYFSSGVLLYYQESVLEASTELARRVALITSTIRRSVAEMPCRLPEDAEAIRFHDVGVSAPLLITGTILGGLAVLGAAYYGYDMYATQQQKMTAANDKTATAIQGYIASRDAAFQEAATQEALGASALTWNQVKIKRINREGWIAKASECTGAVCTLQYARGPNATFNNFVLSKEKDEEPVVQLTDLEAGSMLLNLKGFEELPKLNLDTFQQPVDYKVDFGTRAQLMRPAGVFLTFGQEVVLGDANFVKDLPKGFTSLRKVGKWEAKGPGDTFVPMVRRLPGNVTLSSVKLNVSREGITFEATGRYFLR